MENEKRKMENRSKTCGFNRSGLKRLSRETVCLLLLWLFLFFFGGEGGGVAGVLG